MRPKHSKLTIKAEKFAIEWLRTGNGSDSYRAAYDTSRMRLGTINDKASLLLKHPDVAAFIAAQRAKTAENAMFGVLDVLREWVDIATADPNELMRVRRLNCRHCHGVDHNYQYRDAREFADTVANAIDANATRERQKLGLRPLPSDAGGYGYAFNAKPHPACPHCKGEGTLDTFVADTNLLTGKARKLFAGFKQTKDGLQILTRDQDGALSNIAKALGMMTERVKLVDPKEKDSTPSVPLDAVEAARVYQAMMRGDPT